MSHQPSEATVKDSDDHHQALGEVNFEAPAGPACGPKTASAGVRGHLTPRAQFRPIELLLGDSEVVAPTFDLLAETTAIAARQEAGKCGHFAET